VASLSISPQTTSAAITTAPSESNAGSGEDDKLDRTSWILLCALIALVAGGTLMWRTRQRGDGKH
jgi:hypothetical protein